jgi:hypothetical protein
LGLSEFVFSGHAGGSVSQSSKGSIEVNSSDKVQFSSVAESDRQKLFEEFQEWLRNKELSSQVKPSQLQASDSICKECPVCFHDGVAVFGLPESSGVFPGCTVSIKETWMLTVSQSPFSPVLRPGETGFVLCTYKDLALVQGPDILGVMSCKSLQLISCVVSLLFCASSLKNSLNECVLFSEVMSNVAKRCTRQGSLALQNSLSTSSVFLIQNFFSVFDREYVDSFEFPIQFQLDLIFLCHSASTFTNSFKHVLQSFFPSVEDLSKMVRFLFAFGSVHWEKAVPHFSFFSFASGICQVKQHIQEHFFEILFPCNRSSFQNGVVLYNLISSLSSAEVSYFAHLLRHSALPLNFFIPFVHYIASGILSGNVNGDKSHCIILFLQNCIPPGAFLQLRYALVHLFSRLPNQFHCRRNINEIHVTTIPRWIIDLLAPNLGAPCTAIVNGEMQSILPQCGWCVIAVAGHPALRLPLHEGMVLDSIYCAQVPVSHVTVCARLPFQEHFVLDAIESLLSKQLISKTNSTIPQYYFSSNSSLIPSPCFASHQTFNCIGDMYCQAVHAVFSLFKRSPVLLEGDLFLKLCRKSDEVEICFSCSYIAFVLSKILASGKIVRRGQWLSSAENSLHVHNSPFKPFEVRLTEASCIKSMVIFACDEAAALPSLHLSTAGACESYVYEDALSLVRESFSRIHQVTGIDLGEISDCFNFCKGRLIDTVHELMFSPKFSSKRTKDQTSSDASFARCIRFVEEGFCPTCLSDKILVALPCDHRYCQECLQLYIQDSMANSSTPKAAAGADRAGGRLVTNISCPSHIQGCSYMISSSDVKFVATNEHSSFIDLICRQATRTMASGSYSTATCACGRLIMGETNECEYECLCGRIASVGDLKNGCVVHKWIAHPLSSCVQEERWKEYTQPGSEARQILLRTKRCPSCGTQTTKCGCQGTVICNQLDKCPNEACDHMKCGVCHSDWCWVCGRLGSTESRCSYPPHLVSQAKELFQEAEKKVKQMEKQIFAKYGGVIRFDPASSAATVLSVDHTDTAFICMRVGDKVISINGRQVDSAECAEKVLSSAWFPGHCLHVEYQCRGRLRTFVCRVPSEKVSEPDASFSHCPKRL